MVDPVISACRRIPFPLEEPVHRKLSGMGDDGIIVSVSEPTDWVSHMLVVKKVDGDDHIVLDPSNLNKAVLRPHFSVSIVEQLFAQIGKEKFSAVRCSAGSLSDSLIREVVLFEHYGDALDQVSLSPNTIGLKSAPEVQLHTMSELFRDFDGVIC